jgi:anti-sigma factor RsiW
MIDDRVRENLVAYLDDELTAEERAEVERLVREDPEVARELESFRATDALLDEYPVPVGDVDLTERVLRKARRHGRLLRLRPLVAVAASLAILAAILFVLGDGNGEPAQDIDPDVQELAIENLHALEYMALVEEAGEDADALLDDVDLLLVVDASEVGAK